MSHGRDRTPILICPARLLDLRQVFTDCIHLLSRHEPGNELHVVSEISVPGSNVDYILASSRGRKVRDFVGIELQTMDTTGTVWPARQRFLERFRASEVRDRPADNRTYGMNWKHTAKTVLVQLHHKIQTFESVNRHLVLVVQDALLAYLRANFDFAHVGNARLGEPMQFHAYEFHQDDKSAGNYVLRLATRLSTDAEGRRRVSGTQGGAARRT